MSQPENGAPENGVSADDVRKIARLSRLHVEDAQCGNLADELNGILGWIEQLGEVDVEGVEPMTSAVDMSAPMRADEITDGGKRDDVLKNAPKKDDGFFVVPRSVE
ncbi:MAG: Asp-tRNA(Asn)/Glu-tRNA(Gln) amidotransferase subunit GatC [Litorimonas sp.]